MPEYGYKVQITEKPLADYIAGNKKQTGIILLRPLEINEAPNKITHQLYTRKLLLLNEVLYLCRGWTRAVRYDPSRAKVDP